MPKVFIDGSAGTTGLRIYERLRADREISLIEIPEELRKDAGARAECMNQADVVFFCLPDAAAAEAVSLVGNPDTVIIDTSTVHRTNPGWTYGFPELTGMRERIAASRRIANPGCHASGFIALVAPLVGNGCLSDEASVACFSLTGYSGGGKKMIAEYTDEGAAQSLTAPRMYGLNQNHKHLAEMTRICGLKRPPLFCPIVSSYYSGMEVTVELNGSDLKCTVGELKELYRSYYPGGIVSFADSPDEGGFLRADALSGSDRMEISVYGNDERILLVSRFDNLGKGASGAAIQNMNVVLGRPEETGLVL